MANNRQVNRKIPSSVDTNKKKVTGEFPPVSESMVYFDCNLTIILGK